MGCANSSVDPSLINIRIPKKYKNKSGSISNGETISYRETGTNSNPVILIHGCSMSSVMMEPIMEMLKDNHHCIALDVRGHGYSSYK